MKLEYLLTELGVEACENIDGDLNFEAIAEREEELSENRILILIKRLSEDMAFFDGNGKNMPVAVICDKNAVIKNCSCPIIRVPSPRRALAYAHSMLNEIDYDRIKIVAVTGTNGKTTTASIIKRILEHSGHKVGFIGTGKIEIGKQIISDENYSMTTPDPKLLYSSLAKMQKLKCKFCVMEASSHSIALEKISPMKIKLAVFTNLSAEHTDFHRNMEEYFKTKLKLFKMAESGVFNVDDVYGKRGAEAFGKTAITVGILSPAEVSAFEINDLGTHGYEYIYKGKNFKFLMKQKLPGAFNVYNVLCAVAASVALGVKPCDARRTVSEIREIEGRGEIIKGKITVIIDYAHTPFAFKNILLLAKRIKGSGKLRVVFGCGGERDSKKRPEMAKIAEQYADNITVTSDNSRGEDVGSIISDILLGFSDTEKVLVIPERKEAITQAILSAESGDVVAVVGKGAEKYNIDSNGIHPFDEKAIINEALKKRGATR